MKIPEVKFPPVDKDKFRQGLKKAGTRFQFKDWNKEQRKTFALYAALLCLVFLVAALIFFFAVLKGPERVMVPDLRGKDLTDALLVMQERELYPRLILKYSDDPLEKNSVLDQSPGPGSIVKAGRRIKLTVSKGAVLDKVGDYLGKDLEQVKLQLQALFAASKALVVIKDPVLYRFDQSAAGTILEQKPLPGTDISGTTILELVVSKGPENAKVAAPDFMGKGLSEVAAAVEDSPLVVDFSMRQAKKGEALGKVVEQRPEAGAEIDSKERLQVTLTAPAAAKGAVFGVYKYTLKEYPYPVPLKLESLSPSGQRSLLVAFNHPGGQFSLPFSVPSGSTLVLSVLDKELARTEVGE